MNEKEAEEIKKIKAEISKKGQSMSKGSGSQATPSSGLSANKNWEDDQSSSAKGFKFIHVIVVSIVFLLLGSYLAQVPMPVDPTVAEANVEATIAADQAEIKQATEAKSE